MLAQWWNNCYSTTNMVTIKAKLLTLREEYGGYTLYVFENLEPINWINKYIMLVRYPNWNCPILNPGDTGYLAYKEVVAGRDSWWDPTVNMYIPYKYNNNVFDNFVMDLEKEDLTVMLQILCKFIRCTLNIQINLYYLNQ